jgi:hypothetical protein
LLFDERQCVFFDERQCLNFFIQIKPHPRWWNPVLNRPRGHPFQDIRQRDAATDEVLASFSDTKKRSTRTTWWRFPARCLADKPRFG